MEIIHSGYFYKEGNWVRSWKRRYFEISVDGKIIYKERENSEVPNGVFDISGRLNIERGTCPSSIKTMDSCSMWIQSDSTGRKLHVVLDNEEDYRKFCMAIAQACKFHNIYEVALEEQWSEQFLLGHLGNIENSHESDRKLEQERVTAAVASVMEEGNLRSESMKQVPGQKTKRKSSVQAIQSIMYENNDSGTADLSQLQRFNSQQDLEEEDDENASDSSDNDENDEDVMENEDSNFNDSSVLIPSNEDVSAHLDRARARRAGRRRASVANRRAGLARSSHRISVANIESIEEYLRSNITDTISVHDMEFSPEDFQRVINELESNSTMNHITNVDFKGCKLDSDNITSLCTVLTRVASNYAAFQRLKDVDTPVALDDEVSQPADVSIQSSPENPAKNNKDGADDSRITHTAHEPVTYVQLRDNCADEDGCISIGTYLTNPNCHLIELNLSKNNIGDAGAIAIAVALQKNRTVRFLHLGHNGIDKIGCIAIATALHTNDCLESLDLHENRIGAYGAVALGDMLMTHNSTLKRLNLSHQLKKRIGVDGAIHLAKALRLGTCRNSLQSLNLARCNIGFEGCRHIAGALLVNSSVTELDLSGSNFISVEGAMQLALAVVHNSTLEWLGVGNHNLHVKCLRGKISVADLKKQQILYRRKQEQQSTISHQMGDEGRLYMALGSTDGESIDEDKLAVMALHRVMENKPILRCGTKDEDMSSWEFWGVDLEHKATWGARQSSLRDLAAMLEADDQNSSRVEDETAIVIAHLLSYNRLHEYVNIEEGVLPLQKLNGIPNEFHLDLANMKLTSCDAIVIGKLVAENSVARTIELQGNSFAATEGENWIAYALNRNTGIKIDTIKWSSEAMYTDGYKALAALNGTSASGLAIEPQRLDGYFYKLVVIGGGFMFYVATFSDIYTIIIYSNQPDVYNSSWVYLGALFICLPSFIIIMVTILSLARHDPVATLKKVLIVMFQLSKAVETFKSCMNSYESADLLDERYIESIFKGVPQLALQLYIVFYTAINSNVYSLVVLFSAGLSLVTLASVLCLLYDRKVFRLASMAPAENNPLIVRYLAKFLSVFGLGVDDESVKELTNFYSFWVAHYIFSLIYYLMLLSVRAIAVTWLGALTGKSNFIVFLVVFGTRICCIYMLDCADRATTRPWFRTLVLALSLCVTDSAWVKEEEYPIESRNGFRVLATLTTVENIVFISYSLNVCLEEGSLPNIISVPLFGACMTAIMVRWLLIDYWLLPIHYPELQDNNDADEDTTDEDRVVSHKNDMEMIRLLAQTESGDPSQKKQGVNRRLSSLLNDQGKFSNLFSSSTAAAPIKIGWQPSRKKGFYDMRRKQQDASEGGRMGGIMKTIQNSTRNFRMAMEGEKGEESKVEKMTAVAEGNENEPDSDDEYEVAESDAALGRTRTQSGNSVGSRKTPESPETISTKPVHNPNVDRLLHIGVLEKSGPSTMIWYPWLSRLVMFTTKSVKYFSIPYVEHSEGRKGARKSVSKGFKAPQSARGSISSEEMRVQGLINSDIEELLEFRMSMMQLNDCGLVMVGRILHDKGYKLKGEIKFSAVLGVTVDVNKKVLHVDFATATRVFHFRTQKLSEKGAIDTALTIVASQLHGECEFTDEVEEHNPEILTGVVDSVGPKNDNSVRESSASLFRITYTDAARESNDIGYGALSNGAKPSRAKSIKPFEPICEDDVQDTADIELSMMEQARKRQSKRPSVAPVSISDDQLISQTETERLIQLAHDMSPPSPRLLYIGMLEKTGGSLFSSGWLTRLVIVSTQCVEYFSIPYVESAGGLDLAKEADKQKAIQDYTECTQLRAAMIRYPESGYQLVKSLLEDRNYKKKGEIPFAVIDGYSAQINNKNVLIFDIPTKQNNRTYHFRTSNTEEKLHIDNTMSLCMKLHM